MTKNFIIKKTKQFGGGSKLGETNCSYSFLKQLFGKPNTDSDYSKAMWYVKVSLNGKSHNFYIYDHKSYGKVENITEWMIGGNRGSEDLKEGLIEYINEKLDIFNKQKEVFEKALVLQKKLLKPKFKITDIVMYNDNIYVIEEIDGNSHTKEYKYGLKNPLTNSVTCSVEEDNIKKYSA